MRPTSVNATKGTVTKNKKINSKDSYRNDEEAVKILILLEFIKLDLYHILPEISETMVNK